MACYTVEKLQEGVHMISEKHVRMFLVEGTEGAVLIDTGFGGGNLAQLVREITDRPVTVINTHAHRDHCGADAQFELIMASGADFGALREITGTKPGQIFDLVALRDGDELDIGGRTLRVIEIPGHTPGSIALLDAEHRILFSGDTLQEGPVYLFLEGSSLEAFEQSLEKLDELKGSYDVVYAAHNKLPIDASYIEDLLTLTAELVEGTAEPLETLDREGQIYHTYGKGRVKIYYD